MNFILDQEEKVKQLEEYMGVIGNDFIQLSLEVVEKLKEEIRMEENRVKKIKKIIRYPDTEDLEPLNGHKFSKALTEKASFHKPKFVSPKSLSVKYVHTIFRGPSLVRESTFGFKPEVEETLGTPIKVEPLDETQLEDLGLNTCNHDLSFSPREIPSIYEPEPQPQPLPKFPSLDVSLEEEKNSPANIHVNPSISPDPSVAFITKKVLKFNSFFKSLGLVPQSSHTEVVCTKGDDGEVMFIEIIRKNDDSREDGPEEEGNITTEGVGVEYFDMFPTRNELAYHKYLMYGSIPLIFLRNPIITEGCPSNLKIPCNIGHVHVEKAYIDPNSPLNIMTRMMYNWIMSRKLDPRENSNRGIRNFTRRIKGMHVFIGNFTYIVDFMIVENISSIIDPRLSQVVLGKPFVEISNMTHDPLEGVVRFTNRNNEVSY
ncbi:hypothetical protein Tco_0476020 [Tanacetum coccineum]